MSYKEAILAISGYKAPASFEYWEECIGEEIEQFKPYSQFGTYYKGDIVTCNEIAYTCLHENGYKFGDIRIPMVTSWLEAFYEEWQPVEYHLWDMLLSENGFYTLMSLEGFDNNQTPLESANWGAVADYDSEYNEYELNRQEYVVMNNKVFYPELDPHADIPEIGRNFSPNDPRNFNLKMHMVRLAIYELTKLTAPNNVSIVRIKDYENSMKWLSDAAKLKLNPQIPRKLSDDKKPVMDWQLSTFQTSYDPYKNPWLT